MRRWCPPRARDLAPKFDPIWTVRFPKRFKNPERARNCLPSKWFRLTIRDMGPRARCLGAEVPKEALIWQDPTRVDQHTEVDAKDLAGLKEKSLTGPVHGRYQ